MDKILRRSLLYDFYGELLTEHQKSVYEDYVLNDIGLSEIASERGISRQGVHDLVKRCDSTLENYENKLKLLSRFLETKDMVKEIQSLTKEVKNISKDNNEIQLISRIEELSVKIIDEL